jgi:hypothetical protein
VRVIHPLRKTHHPRYFEKSSRLYKRLLDPHYLHLLVSSRSFIPQIMDTAPEYSCLTLSELLSKIKELARGQERYSAVIQEIETTEELVLRAAKPAKHIDRDDLGDNGLAKLNLTKLRLQARAEKIENEAEYICNAIIKEFTSQFLDTTTDNPSILKGLQYITQGLALLCGSIDRSIQQKIHQEIYEELVRLEDFSRLYTERKNNDWAWLLNKRAVCVLDELEFTHDDIGGTREKLKNACSQSRAVACAVRELSAIFGIIREIDKSKVKLVEVEEPKVLENLDVKSWLD